MLDKLINQRDNKIKGGIYHFIQILFSYNSNKIEGSKLSHEDTLEIFETNVLKNDSLIKYDDIVETRNHFKLFDYMLDIVNDDISVSNILKMHDILKRDTTDSDDFSYNVGGFKLVDNVIGNLNEIETSSVKDVENDINNLINNYLLIDNITLEDIVDFHYKFERIHPFSDGNGRVGRIIMFKECLKHNIIPFIINDNDKYYYLKGLKEYTSDKVYLIDTCKKSQDDFLLMIKNY